MRTFAAASESTIAQSAMSGPVFSTKWRRRTGSRCSGLTVRCGSVSKQERILMPFAAAACGLIGISAGASPELAMKSTPGVDGLLEVGAGLALSELMTISSQPSASVASRDTGGDVGARLEFALEPSEGHGLGNARQRDGHADRLVRDRGTFQRPPGRPRDRRPLLALLLLLLRLLVLPLRPPTRSSRPMFRFRPGRSNRTLRPVTHN